MKTQLMPDIIQTRLAAALERANAFARKQAPAPPPA